MPEFWERFCPICGARVPVENGPDKLLQAGHMRLDVAVPTTLEVMLGRRPQPNYAWFCPEHSNPAVVEKYYREHVQPKVI